MCAGGASNALCPFPRVSPTPDPDGHQCSMDNASENGPKGNSEGADHAQDGTMWGIANDLIL